MRKSIFTLTRLGVVWLLASSAVAGGAVDVLNMFPRQLLPNPVVASYSIRARLLPDSLVIAGEADVVVRNHWISGIEAVYLLVSSRTRLDSVLVNGVPARVRRQSPIVVNAPLQSDLLHYTWFELPQPVPVGGSVSFLLTFKTYYPRGAFDEPFLLRLWYPSIELSMHGDRFQSVADVFSGPFDQAEFEVILEAPDYLCLSGPGSLLNDALVFPHPELSDTVERVAVDLWGRSKKVRSNSVSGAETLKWYWSAEGIREFQIVGGANVSLDRLYLGTHAWINLVHRENSEAAPMRMRLIDLTTNYRQRAGLPQASEYTLVLLDLPPYFSAGNGLTCLTFPCHDWPGDFLQFWTGSLGYSFTRSPKNFCYRLLEEKWLQVVAPEIQCEPFQLPDRYGPEGDNIRLAAFSFWRTCWYLSGDSAFWWTMRTIASSASGDSAWEPEQVVPRIDGGKLGWLLEDWQRGRLPAELKLKKLKYEQLKYGSNGVLSYQVESSFSRPVPIEAMYVMPTGAICRDTIRASVFAGSPLRAAVYRELWDRPVGVIIDPARCLWVKDRKKTYTTW